MRYKEIVITPTQECNLSCRYCYIPSTHKKKWVSKEIVETTFKKILNADTKEVSIIWHGGEPLLMDLDFFRESLDLEKRLNKRDIKIKNNIQTNATLINRDIAYFLKKNNFEVGISLDGPKDVHDCNRIYSDGRGSFDDVMKGISILRERDIPFGIISILNKKSINREKEIYKTIREAGANRARVNLYSSAGKGKIYKDYLELSPKEVSKILINFYDIWTKDNDGNFMLSPFKNIVDSMFTGKSNLCEYQGGCNLNILVVDMYGDLYSCGRFFGIKKYKIGSILKDSLKDIQQSNFSKMLDERKRRIEEICDCEYFKFCRGGCAYESLDNRGSFNEKTLYCESRKELFAHIYNDIKNKIKQ